MSLQSMSCDDFAKHQLWWVTESICCSFHFISSHLISFHFVSSQLISSHLISFHLISFHFISSHLISYHFISSHLISFHLISFHFISCLFISFSFCHLYHSIFIFHLHLPFLMCACDLLFALSIMSSCHGYSSSSSNKHDNYTWVMYNYMVHTYLYTYIMAYVFIYIYMHDYILFHIEKSRLTTKQRKERWEKSEEEVRMSWKRRLKRNMILKRMKR